MTVEIINTNQDGEGIPYYGQTEVLPSWPRTDDHRAAWDEAKRIKGPEASISDIARAAQEILRRMRMPAEDEMEHARRLV
jgi:hypothetical protein